jgi:hypothetical protein
MTIDAAKAAACVETYRLRACSPPRSVNLVNPVVTTVAATPNVEDLIAKCPGLFTGRILDGNRCEMTAECAPGSRCAGSSTGGAAPDPYYPQPQPPPRSPVTPVGGLGVCTRAQGANEPCNDSNDCDRSANLVCRQTEYRCGPPPGLLETCNVNILSPIADETLCDTTMGLACDPNTVTCNKRPVEGQPCLSDDQALGTCSTDTPLACVGFEFGLGVCRRPSARGQACGASAIPPCAAGLACRPTQPDGIGVCDDPPGLSQPCDPSGACASPYVCASSGRCMAPGPKHVGEECEQDADCDTLSCLYPGAAFGFCAPTNRPIICSSAAVTPGSGKFTTPMGGFDTGLPPPLP